ncbi:MAG: lipoyltransferase, partial [Muribaculaceae bacterium]|nr:lipoyltransferase [Muribaculaceae bacterium]
PMQRLPFYLAMEEFLARQMQGEFFFMWQVAPTVICGRNQDIDKEVNRSFCEENGIEIVRRKSGGGCVYANPDNIMFSHITSGSNVQDMFAKYTEAVAGMLRSFGLQAEASGRNDVLVDGKKVSGNAFYHLHGRNIIHGTMLYDTNYAHLAKAITPQKSKLESKQVKSVESRITTLNKHLTIGIADFMAYAKRYMCSDGEIKLDDDSISQIKEIEKEYYRPEWLAGKKINNPYLEFASYQKGVGSIMVSLALDGDKIADIEIEGDFLELQPLEAQLLPYLKGVKYASQAIETALAENNVVVNDIIANMSNENFVNLIS